MEALRVPAAEQEGLWEVDEVARYLRVPKSSVYKLTSKPSPYRIPHLKIGGRLRFRRADIDAWLDLLAVTPSDTLMKIRSLTRTSSAR